MFKRLFGGKNDKYKFTVQEPTTETCPNCGAELENISDWKNGKIDCPHCEGVIVVRTGKLFAEDEANVRDGLESVNRRLFDYEITREEFNQIREELSKEFGLIASVNDTLWRILNSINTPDKSYQDRKFIYMAMDDILRGEGKSSNEILAKVCEMELLGNKELSENLGINLVVKSKTVNDSYVCDECKKLSEETFTIDEALETMPIPHRCTNDVCRCYWTFTPPGYD